MDAQLFPTTTDINHEALNLQSTSPNLHLSLRFSRWCTRTPRCMTQPTAVARLASRYKCMRGSPLPRSHLPHTTHTMAPPSSCHISGIFSLSEGSRNTEPRYYATYLSALEFTDDEKFINVSIRKFTASADILYADNSFIFLVAKAALPAGEDGILDSIYCAPFISPPEGFQPPSPAHTASVTGTVSSVNTSGSTRSFTLTTSEYVRDERRTFTVRFVFLEYPASNSRLLARIPVLNMMEPQTVGRMSACQSLGPRLWPSAFSRTYWRMAMASPFSTCLI